MGEGSTEGQTVLVHILKSMERIQDGQVEVNTNVGSLLTAVKGLETHRADMQAQLKDVATRLDTIPKDASKALNSEREAWQSALKSEREAWGKALAEERAAWRAELDIERRRREDVDLKLAEYDRLHQQTQGAMRFAQIGLASLLALPGIGAVFIGFSWIMTKLGFVEVQS